jgi:hypothetical protein
MWYCISGLAGVLLGATIASVLCLHLLQRRADRDLIERRLRSILGYRECLGDLEGVLDGAADPLIIEQAWKNIALFCREFRLSGWLLAPEDREPLGRIAGELERESRRARRNGSENGSAGAALARLAQRREELERLLRRAAERQIAEHRRFRFLPEIGSRGWHEEGAA